MLYLVWCPRTGSSLNPKPNIIQTLKPLVCRRLIANLTPDSLLNIQSRLITGQVLQVQPHVGLDKEVNFLSLMPSGSIHIEPNRITTKPLIEVSQTLKESFSIALRPLHHAPSSKQRGHPTHPNRFSLCRCWLVVGTRNRFPTFAHPIPSRGCSVKPVSSSKTIVSLGLRDCSFF
jgi:hypothetical protein